jgi:sugar/nucleoside kinase (ribokinase family)
MSLSKKFDVIVVGELNIDLILNKIDGFPEMGCEKLADQMTMTLGSSSAIFASNLRSLGPKVAFLGMIGKDTFADLVKKSLWEKGIFADFIIEDANENTGITVVMNYNEDRAMVTYPGAMNNLTIKDVRLEFLETAKHLHFASPFLQPGIRDDLAQLFKTAKSLGLSTSFDCQWDPKEKWDLDWDNILPNVDVFLPNEKEICAITKSSDPEEALKKIKNTNTIVIKKGNRGAMLADKNSRISAKPFLNKNVVDAIGAGDSFDAGFVFKFIENHTNEECLEFGNLMGALNTTAHGGTGAFRNYDQIIKSAKKYFGYRVE